MTMAFGYDDYGALAKKQGISEKEKSGRYKEMDEAHIFADIRAKAKLEGAKSVLNIGCGCSKPAVELAEFCEKTGAACVMVDHPNMIAQLKGQLAHLKSVKYVEGRFPAVKGEVQKISAQFDAVVIYSVLHYIIEMNYFKFLDEAASLLAPGGRMLVGDIPNESKKQRFLSSEWGREFHMKWSGGKPPVLRKPGETPSLFDDSSCAMILQRYREAGFETYLLPQNELLPFCYTREDILIIRQK